MNNQQVLITGGDGYLGFLIAQKYLSDTKENVLLWVRAIDESGFQIKANKLHTNLAHFGDRVSYCWGDLRQAEPFKLVNQDTIRLIIHTAGVTRFNVDKEAARQVNVEGTQKLLQFAEQCRFLEGIGLLSSIYASGKKSGLIEEKFYDAQDGFANHYEWSKWASEQLLPEQFAHLPWRIFRVATVIADSCAGNVTQYNVFHNTLKLFYYGLLSLIPGQPETPLYFVTGEFVAEAIVQLMNCVSTQKFSGDGFSSTPEQAPSIYHLAYQASESSYLEEVIECAFAVFAQEENFVRRHILKPLYTDAESFFLLADVVNDFSGAIVKQAVSSISPFAQQLFIYKEIQNQNLRAVLDGYQVPNPRELIRNTCSSLTQTKWMKKALAQAT